MCGAQVSGSLLRAVLLPDTSVAVTGATQVGFLGGGTQVAALCSDGSARVVDVVGCRQLVQVRHGGGGALGWGTPCHSRDRAAAA